MAQPNRNRRLATQPHVKLWVISPGNDDGTFQHFWTPRGLKATSRAKANAVAQGARRAAWAGTIIVEANTYRAAYDKALQRFQQAAARRG